MIWLLLLLNLADLCFVMLYFFMFQGQNPTHTNDFGPNGVDEKP